MTANTTPPGGLLRLHPRVRTETAGDGSRRLVLTMARLGLDAQPPGIRAALGLLAERPVPEAEVQAAVAARDGEAGLLRLASLLARLRAGGWLCTVLPDGGGQPLVTLRPLGVQRTPGPAPDGPLRLSRFAVLRREGGALLLESPRAQVAAELHDPRLAGALAALPDAAPDGYAEAIGALARHGLLVPADGAAEDGEFALRQWSPHELWFHGRSRLGRTDLPFGGTYWAEGTADPLPAVREPFGGPVLDLPVPSMDKVRAQDPPLTAVLEDRRSIRVHDDAAPLTRDALGEFLYRTSRNRGRLHDGHQELGARPYPSGGRACELEVYPLVGNVDGVPPGLYHYDAERHRLELVAEPGPLVSRLAAIARATAVMDADPQVALLITARFGRVMWKYQSMAYALVLKHVGVLYQVMYSVATAMGLAPCSLGGGDADAFAAASGLPWEQESTVGEFVLGTPGNEEGRGIPS